MAQSTLHFALGMAVGAALYAPALRRAWIRGERLARPAGRWLVAAYGLGLYASLPAVFRRLGAYEMWTESWWVNVFILYPAIQRLNVPSILLGETLIAALFAIQYLVIVQAIRRVGKATPGPEHPGAVGD